MTKQETETDVTIHNGGEGNGNLKNYSKNLFLDNFLRTFGENKNKLFRFKKKKHTLSKENYCKNKQLSVMFLYIIKQQQKLRFRLKHFGVKN